MHSLELKKDPEAGIDFTEEDHLGEIMPRLLKEQGLLMRAGTSLSIAPPLVPLAGETTWPKSWFSFCGCPRCCATRAKHARLVP